MAVARVGDGEPVVAVGGPQDEFDGLVVGGAGAVADGVGDEFGGQQGEVVGESGPAPGCQCLYLTDSIEALRTLIREVKAGKADHLL